MSIPITLTVRLAPDARNTEEVLAGAIGEALADRVTTFVTTVWVQGNRYLVEAVAAQDTPLARGAVMVPAAEVIAAGLFRAPDA
jgi:hypothetical protein